MPVSRTPLLMIGLAGALGLALVAGCSDKDIERTIGKQTAAAIESSYKVVDDPLVADYVDTMGHILVGHSRRQDIPYQFKVIETDIVNAAAVPWGYVYLTTGLLEFVESEDELWAITGHEIGHQVGRDSVKAMKENILLSLATILIGRETRLGADIADMGFDLLQLKHSRGDEYRADDHGTAVIYAAGYDPTAHTRFFERLMEEIEHGSPNRLETLFLTHPPTKARIKRQNAKPEVALTDPGALAHVGAGYARRSRYAEAIEKLSKAVELDGENLPARLLLADCHLIRGERDRAAEHYQAALDVDPSLVSAQEGLRAAQADSARGERIAASDYDVAAAKAGIAHAAERVNGASDAAEAATGDLPRQLKPISEGMRRSLNTLVAVGARTGQLSEPAREIALTTGLAIAEASESVYSIEHLGELFADTVSRATRAAEMAATAARGALSAEQAAILTRSARELSSCAAEVETLSEELPPLVKTAENAGRTAENAATRVSQALIPGSTLAERQIAVDSVKLSQQRGAKARERARAGAERAAQARTRSLVAEISIAGVVLGATRATASDNLVAYYTQTDSESVRVLREENDLGLGEAALLLAAAKSSQRPVESLLTLAGNELSVVDAARDGGATLSHVNFFLRFIADALAEETAG